jgi:4'-phosphopantetheinyl transferase
MSSPSHLWSLPPEQLVLGDGELHVWQAGLELAASEVQNLFDLLSAEERARAARFYFPRDRNRFIVARGRLRSLLSRYLGVAPGQLEFDYSPYGKPALREDCGSGLRFNLSHSHKLALYVVTRNREVGIDLEYWRADLADGEVARRFFSPREVSTLLALPAEMRLEAFFNCWTRKEAYIKARGEGLSLPLDQFDVTLTPGEPAALIRTLGDPQEASRWSLLQVFPGPGYSAALAVEGKLGEIKYWRWPE